MAVGAVLLLGDLHRLLVAGVVERYDLKVVEDHKSLLSVGDVPLTYIHNAAGANVPRSMKFLKKV